MEALKTIDVKGLEHGQREGLIFPGIEALDIHETVRIVVEFNPMPLVYMFKAGGEYDVTYEKEGPDEWILLVTRITPKKDRPEDDRPNDDRKEQFKELLAELKEGEVSQETKEKAKTLFQTIDATTLAVMEQELIREGVSHDEIRKSLCDIHLEALRDSLVAKQIEVSAPHPVNTFMAEHKIILDSLTELASLVESLADTNSFEDFGADQEKLKDIAHHLVEAESHHQREEDILFPELEKHDIVEPPAIMKLDHVEFRARKQELYQLAHNHQDTDFPQFKARVIELGKYLATELESHIFKEDNILYQIALQLLTPEEWQKVKKECDKIGYCCFTPEDQNKEEDMVELDLRQIIPPQRHGLIFQKWDALKPGETLKIINDHDPKPLYYQFEAEFTNQFQW